MAAPNIRRAAELSPTPWPNGRGLTRDVVRQVGPDGALAWLVSIADLTQDAPFSHFPGIDRTFTLVEGGPVELVFEGTAALRCLPLVPALFPGDRPAHCRLAGGPARAFNVFADRTRHRARVSVAALADGHALALPALAAVHCAAGRVAGGGATLEAGDTWLDAAPMAVRAAGGSATLVLVAIEPVD